MTRILIAEDEEGLRNSIERMLGLEGYEVAASPNGQQAWVLARSMVPDVLVTDIHMPGMDGFALLDAVRGHPDLAECAVIMLTAAEDRANMRRGMSSGADDYITKPFKREELLNAIQAQIKKRQGTRQQRERAVAAAVSALEERLRRQYTAELSAPVDASRPAPLANIDPAPSGEVALQVATVMFADIRNFTSAAEKLSVTEVAHVLAEYFLRACNAVHKRGGHHLKILGDGLMVVFDDESRMAHTPSARRALQAGLDLAVVAAEFQAWLDTWYAGRGLPPFAIGLGVHTGEVMFGRLGSAVQSEVTPLGDAVNTAARFEELSKSLGWTLVASQDTVNLAGSGVELGRHQTVSIRGRIAQAQVCEVLGLTAPAPADAEGWAAQAQQEEHIRQAIAHNSQVTARAVKGAIQQSLAQLDDSKTESGLAKRFKNYTIERKIGQGGMSEVYLAHDSQRSEPIVLKLLRTEHNLDVAMLQRFIQEYAVLSAMDHPHIARIFDQGFTDDFAYIAMEYLSGGSLQDKVGSGLPDAEILRILRQIAHALEALHTHSLVHRDLKPENLLYRHSGELVLADFGVVKRICGSSDGLVKTLHGQLVGTPYYFSPEQATHGEVGFQSDFYSLGVILFELLTGQRPYLAESLEALIARHLYADIPALPLHRQRFQHLLARLMAKKPHERFQSVAQLLAAMDALPAA